MSLITEEQVNRCAEYVADIHASYGPASYAVVRILTELHAMDGQEAPYHLVRNVIIGHEIADESDWATVIDIMKWVYSILWQETQAGGAA